MHTVLEPAVEPAAATGAVELVLGVTSSSPAVIDEGALRTDVRGGDVTA